jgi:hypothetical protein
MYPPTHVLVFALGCIGALAPEIVRFYRQRHKPPKSIFSLWYFLITAAYAALGGVVALALPAVTLWGALFAGVSTPVLISTAAKHREKSVYAANEKQDFILKATDRSREVADKFPMYERQSDPVRISPLKKFVEFVQDHADGLFE